MDRARGALPGLTSARGRALTTPGWALGAGRAPARAPEPAPPLGGGPAPPATIRTDPGKRKNLLLVDSLEQKRSAPGRAPEARKALRPELEKRANHCARGEPGMAPRREGTGEGPGAGRERGGTGSKNDKPALGVPGDDPTEAENTRVAPITY